MSYVLAFLGFSLLVLLHELGHFAAAKAVGMRAERFSLFFPPHLLKIRRGETEYCIGAIPLGGYVRITGMSPNEELEGEAKERAYVNQPVWKRIVVIAAGPAMNILVAFLILFGLFLAEGVTVGTTRVASVAPQAAAAQVIRAGDQIVAVDGVTGDPSRLAAQIATHRCAGTPQDGCSATTPAAVTVRRNGRLESLAITPRYDAQVGTPRLGITFASDTQPVGPFEAVRRSGDSMWRVSTRTVDAITRIFYDSSARKEVSGVVGSYEATRASFAFDWVRAMLILAVISLSLALVNLFPFLPLDGGHIFWALAEKVRGRPIPYRVMERASVVGFVLVVFLFAVGLSNDIGRLLGDGFQVR
ncbi:unannotated protein [freshwater metagenome]|uniref:Unannotated protein n=1 Tax=freshwater metagenome TaxID=449393 RepID=A0A6J7EF72_9ZZZZ|nr:peptidase M50 [Actinomycetota bacterium]